MEPQYRVWPADDATFHPRRVIRLKHSLTTHPLMQLPALRRLAEKFEAEGKGQVKFVRPGTTSADPLHLLTQSDRGWPVAAVFDHLEEPGSWVSLYNVQTDPDYRAMI